MTHLKHTLFIAGIVASIAPASFALDLDFDKITCGEFARMSPEDQSATYAFVTAARTNSQVASSELDAGSDKTNPAAADTYTVPATGAAPTDGTVSDAENLGKDTTANGDTVSAPSVAKQSSVAGGREDTSPEVTALLDACDAAEDNLLVDMVQQ